MSADTRIRVVVVEDSAAVRKVVSDALNSDREITVVGTAANGRIGLAEVARLEPDLITLDIEMPEMDGLTMLSELRKTNRRVPVIMVSTLTGRGASATLDALARGATDYVTKPSSAAATTATSAIEHFKRELLPRVKALTATRSSLRPVGRPSGQAESEWANLPPGARPAAAPSSGPPRIALRPPRAGQCELLAIGSSTGGPNAIELVLTALSADFPAPILVTQHMPPMFTKMLADRLDQKCQLHAVEAEDGMVLANGTIYVAPGDYHLTVVRNGLTYETALTQGPPENSCRPAVDVMFRSAAETYGSRVLGVVMTGMGYDGRVGAGALTKAGSDVIVQDQATSVVWGMPGAVAEAGLASEVVPLDQLAATIDRRFGRRSPKAAFAPRPTGVVRPGGPLTTLSRLSAASGGSAAPAAKLPAPAAPSSARPSVPTRVPAATPPPQRPTAPLRPAAHVPARPAFTGVARPGGAAVPARTSAKPVEAPRPAPVPARPSARPLAPAGQSFGRTTDRGDRR